MPQTLRQFKYFQSGPIFQTSEQAVFPTTVSSNTYAYQQPMMAPAQFHGYAYDRMDVGRPGQKELGA